jgi:diguanylate cyclase (GGDEF)-like protein
MATQCQRGAALREIGMQRDPHNRQDTLGNSRYRPAIKRLGRTPHDLAARQPFRDFEYRRAGEDGALRFISVSGVPLFENGEFRGYCGIGRDITERKRSEERLAYLAWCDSLTGLPNRHRLQDDLTQMLAQPQPSAGWIGCVIVKLDHFKDVNSIYGRRAGDQLLVEAAERLRRNARDSDTVGRLGDDEFVLLLPKLATTDDAGLVAQKVIDALAAPFNLGGLETHISANIGIAIYPGDGDDPEGLLKNADAAMHRAKEQGRNTFRLYLPRMNELARERLQVDRAGDHRVDVDARSGRSGGHAKPAEAHRRKGLDR